jgi:hypothetical protein
MTIGKSRALLVFAMLAVSSVAAAASPGHVSISNPGIQSHAQMHRLNRMPETRLPVAQPKGLADDPFASLLLG